MNVAKTAQKCSGHRSCEHRRWLRLQILHSNMHNARFAHDSSRFIEGAPLTLNLAAIEGRIRRVNRKPCLSVRITDCSLADHVPHVLATCTRSPFIPISFLSSRSLAIASTIYSGCIFLLVSSVTRRRFGFLLCLSFTQLRLLNTFSLCDFFSLRRLHPVPDVIYCFCLFPLPWSFILRFNEHNL